MLEAAFRQATGHPCFRRLNRALDGILVSDVGKRMAVQSNGRAGGLIRTSLRATDIVMDRVWQLELENFHDSPSFVFAPITEVVEPTEDPTALHPEIQRQAVNVRTDFDRFSPLEISILVRHGYCVAQGVSGAPRPVWSRVAGWRSLGSHSRATHHRPSRCGAIARSWTVGGASCGHCRGAALQNSALRRIWSTLLDRRDWTSYVYVPLLIPILVLVPYLVVKSQQRSQRINHLVESLSQGSRDLGQMSRLLEGRQQPWVGEPAEEVSRFEETDLRGFEILQDSRIFDLRGWKPVKVGESDAGSLVFSYRRLKVFKQPDNGGNNVFHVYLLGSSPQGRPVPDAAASAKTEHEQPAGREPRREGVSLARQL